MSKQANSVKPFNVRGLCGKRSSKMKEDFFFSRMALYKRTVPYGIEEISKLKLSF